MVAVLVGGILEHSLVDQMAARDEGERTRPADPALLA